MNNGMNNEEKILVMLEKQGTVLEKHGATASQPTSSALNSFPINKIIDTRFSHKIRINTPAMLP